MHPYHHAQTAPDKPACIMAASGEILTYRDLDRFSNQGAHLFRSVGLHRGDVIAVLLENGPEVFSIGWAAQRSGLYLTSISTKFSAADIAYIVKDAGVKLLIVAADHLETAAQAMALLGAAKPLIFALEGGPRDWLVERRAFPDRPIPDQSAGTDMLYSSGTTGRPKGVKPTLPAEALDAPTPLTAMGQTLYGMGGESIYLSTSPLYHAAPLRWAMTIQRLGGTVVVMERFDAEQALALVARYRVTHATWVPTHFSRLLKLPEVTRKAYDLSSMRAMIHAAAPCPVPVKRTMIEWWGKVIYEYYSGTEMCGITALSPEEWLAKPGSVGRAILGVVKILDNGGNEVPAGTDGQVYFADGPRFEYHNDPEKTRAAYDHRGWATLGDIGRLDEDGYLFLTDRKNFMIISGGVNIYPQEIENHLVTHPKIADAAVIGVPDEEMGESVLAVVQPMPDVIAGPELAEELRIFTRDALGGLKCPKRFDFRADLPREPTGKLMKRVLYDQYRQSATI